MTPLQFVMKNGNNDPLSLTEAEIDSVLMKSFNEFNEHYKFITAHSKMQQELLAYCASSNGNKQKVVPFGMNIYIRTLTSKSFTIKLFPYSTIKDLLDEIQKKESIPPDQVRLVYNGKEIPHSEAPLIWYLTDLDKPQVINLILRLRGGMMHESSGRIGYVDLPQLMQQHNKWEQEARFVVKYARELVTLKNICHQNQMCGGAGGSVYVHDEVIKISDSHHNDILHILQNAIQIHHEAKSKIEEKVKTPIFNIEFMRNLLHRKW